MSTKIYYFEPRLFFSYPIRWGLRVFPLFFYMSAAIIMLLFLFEGGGSRLKYVGIFLLLFLADRYFYRREATRRIDENEIRAAEKVNVADYVAPHCAALLEKNVFRALFLKRDFSLLLCGELLRERVVGEALHRLELDREHIESYLQSLLDSGAEYGEDLFSEVERICIAAFEEARRNKKYCLDESDLFVALLKQKKSVLPSFFNALGVNSADLSFALVAPKQHGFFRRGVTMRSVLAAWAPPSGISKRSVMNRAWTARPTPFLDSVSTDLTALAERSEIGFLIGHEAESAKMLQALVRPVRNQVLLVGEPGVGKETLVYNLSYQIATDNVPKELFDKRVVEVSLHSLLAGAETEGGIQEHVTTLLNEIRDAGNVVLYIPDIHNVVKSSGRQITASDALLSAFREGGFQVIATTYLEEYKRYIELQSAFRDVFEVIRVEEISEAEAIGVLVHLSLFLESKFRLVISYKAIRQAVRLARKHLRDQLLPSSAEELLKEVSMLAYERGERVVCEQDVVELVESKVHIPLRRAEKEEAEWLLHFEDEMRRSVVGQEEAVMALANTLRIYRSGLSRNDGPVATFLFVGPTGVGKTEVAKVVARLVFGAERNMIRLDLAEFQEKNSVSRLIGSVENETKGILTGAIRERPFSLLLLDEFEKAHPDVLNLFLSVFDEGYLTDAWGRRCDFSNVIIVATSNAHSRFILEAVQNGILFPNIKEELKTRLLDYFRPELLNRFSGIIVFKPLTKENLQKIAELQFQKLLREVESKQGLTLSYTNRALLAVVDMGFDPMFGARPLRNVVEGTLKPLIADYILRGITPPGRGAMIDFSNNRFQLSADAPTYHENI